MVSTTLKSVAPNPSQELLDFLSLFHGQHIFAAYNRKSKGRLPGKHYPTDISECYTYLVQLQNNGYEIYFTVNESGTHNRKAEDIIRARAVFVDDDNPREEPRKDFILPPSLITETSKGKFHYYWLTSTTNMEEWRLVQEALIHLYNTDPKIKDPSRVMRLPSFEHYSGFKTKVVGGNKKMYSWEEVIDNYPPIPTELLADKPEEGAEARSIGDMYAIIAAGKPNTGLHSATRDVAWGMLKDGKTAKATIKFLRDLMSGYDMNDPRQKENYDVIERTVFSAAKKLNVTGNKPAQDVPLQELERDWSYLLENNIPEDAIPESVLSAAKEVGDFTSAGEVPAILASVVITSALLGKNVVIHEIDNSLIQRPRMGLLIAMHTGTVKTRVYNHMCEPFFDFQDDLQKQWEEEKHARKEEKAALESKRKKILGKFKSNEDLTRSEEKYMVKELELISKRTEWLDQGKPYLYLDDSTEERLITKMHENEGGMAVLSDDARNTVKNIMGLRYSSLGSGGEGTYIAGLTGSTIDYNRQKDGGTDINIKDPVLNMLLFVQPDIATRFKQSDVYLESGLAARIPIYFYPITGEDIIERRKHRKREEMDHSKVKDYYDALKRLCVISPHFPLTVRLSKDAKKRHAEMDHEFSDILKENWRGHYDKTNKVSTLIVIYATVFAAIDDPEFGDLLKKCERNSDIIFEANAAREISIVDKFTEEVIDASDLSFGEIKYTLDIKYINMGWMFAKCLFSQSIESYEELDKHPITKMARSVIGALDLLYTKGKIWEGFPECAAFNNMMPLTTRKNMSEILTHLVERGWLVSTMRTQVEGKGRLNNGLPNKVVKPGDNIYHLNLNGIKEAKAKLAANELNWCKSDIELLQTIRSE